jgi:hypothetical protein
MANEIITLVFVHGWSVTGMDTYGELPLRIRAEGLRTGMNLDVKEIFLGRYISFHDEVRLHDISRAFQTAVNDQLSDVIKKGSRFMCITHSTGGPVIRDWWHTYWQSTTCPMSHLIMLAPANHGSALAQLGKARIGRLKSWFAGVEPGQGVLDWLELGSRESWDLNLDWIGQKDETVSPEGIFPFVLTGQTIDRKLYDNLNSYTGEAGSDGVVRVASANLNSRYITLRQPAIIKDPQGNFISPDFSYGIVSVAPETAFRVVRKKSHSGDDIGIMKSIFRNISDTKSADTIGAILQCIKVKSRSDYEFVCKDFAGKNIEIQKEELLETETDLLVIKRYFIHDRYSMVIFRVKDHTGHPVSDFDLVLTAGLNDDPNHLPEGFCADRQRNRVNPEVITYFFNFDVLKGCDTVKAGNKVIRPAIPPTTMLGLQITPRPDKGFVRYLPCKIKASEEMFNHVLAPNTTTLVDIVLQRIVDKEVFRIEKLTDEALLKKDFKKLTPGRDIVD